jgi:hypothetical protein
MLPGQARLVDILRPSWNWETRSFVPKVYCNSEIFLRLSGWCGSRGCFCLTGLKHAWIALAKMLVTRMGIEQK